VRRSRALLALALLLCPREFREGYRRDLSDLSTHDVFDVARAGVTLHWEALVRDLTIAFRSLSKARLFAFVSVMSLALAISVNAVVFAAMQAVSSKPLPFVHPQSLAFLCPKPMGDECAQIDNGVIGTYARNGKTLSGVAAFQYFPETLTGHGVPEAMLAYASSVNVFQVLGVRPELGTFFDAKHWFGRVVLSDALWRMAFGADPHVVGKVISLDGARWIVTGVAPAAATMPAPGPPASPASVWLPLPPASFTAFGQFNDWAFARIAPGAAMAQASSDVRRMTGQIVSQHPVQEKGLAVTAVPFASLYFAQTRQFLLLLLAAALAVLLIASANVANLVLMRSLARGGELAVRSALGAGRARILRQIAVEIGVLAVAGGALGLLLAWMELRGLAAAGWQFVLSGVERASIDPVVAAWTFAVMLAATLGAGFVPALLATRRNLNERLRPAGKGGDRRSAGTLRFALGAAQIALAFAVVVSSGLLYRNFLAAASTDPGIATKNVYWATLDLTAPKFNTKMHGTGPRAAFLSAVLARIRALPAVEGTAAVRPNPYVGDLGTEGFAFGLPGRSYPSGTHPGAVLTQITPGYFRLLHVPVIAGRPFSDRDTAGSPRVAIVDQTFAQTYFPNEDPVGREVLEPDPGGAAHYFVPATIVGVARNISVLGRQDNPRLYVPQYQIPSSGAEVFVATRVTDPDLRREVAAAVAAVDPNEALEDFGSLQSSIDANYIAPRRTVAEIVGIVAIIALLLALAGVYAIMAYSVEQQRHEFGIRMAIGATGGDLLRRVLRSALTIAGGGIALGVVLAAAGARVLESSLSRVMPAFDPSTFCVVLVLVVLSTLLASAVPAMRASRVDPAAVLRYE
jgi:putative ABC transport system permease protein